MLTAIKNRSFWLKSTAFALLLLVLTIFHCQRINLTTADLGRHIVNGAVQAQSGSPIKTNFYSYTEPEFEVVNHHWATGVVFYKLWRWVGFEGLSVFYTGLFLATFILFFYTAYRLSNFSWAYFSSVLILPLLASRPELRPEGFSYFFLALYLFILFSCRQKKYSLKVLWVLVGLQIFWVNAHIFFIMGPFLIGVFLLDAIVRKDKEVIQIYSYVFAASLLACLVNPFGVEGALTPLTILKEYGYMLVENQSVPFMRHRFPANLRYVHFELAFAFLSTGLVLFMYKRNWKEWIVPVLIAGAFSVLAWKTNRAIILFAFLFIIFASQCFYRWVSERSKITGVWISRLVIGVSIMIMSLGIFSKTSLFSAYANTNLRISVPQIRENKLWFLTAVQNIHRLPGLMPGVNASSEFFKHYKIEGPVFNNYDIGGYLIFHLFPGRRVFVDNRPEAYSVKFFKDLYIPMQEDERVWAAALKQHQFNVIYFYRHDMTPWAQPFLIRRLKDPKWIPVFVDAYTLILVRNSPRNARIIEKHRIPLSNFQLSQN